MVEGGYNGGGYASNFFGDAQHYGAGSGGGATDIRFEVNDLFHRVIVAGGGGGTDNFMGTLNGDDDGSGGAGGGLNSQGYSIDGIIDKIHIATQVSGFSFGYGESAQKEKSLNENGTVGENASDRGGGGGGWFGGFSSNNGQGGGAGGSSFILTTNATIPQNVIEVHDSFYQFIEQDHYAFLNQNQYSFSSPNIVAGVWDGNGFAIITPLFLYNHESCCRKSINSICPSLLYIFLLVGK